MTNPQVGFKFSQPYRCRMWGFRNPGTSCHDSARCALCCQGASLMMLNQPSLLLPPSRLQPRSPLCALLPGRARFRVVVEHVCYPWS